MVIIDTSVLIDYLRQDLSSDTLFAKALRQDERMYAISMCVITELWQGRSSKEQPHAKVLEEMLACLYVVRLDYEAAKFAGELNRESNYQMGPEDAQVAATAVLMRAPLLTLNTKHFEGIEGLDLIDIKQFT